jgi:hypothetical protein
MFEFKSMDELRGIRKELDKENINELKQPSSFSSHKNAFVFYLNTLVSQMAIRVKNDKRLTEKEKSKRMDICYAHLSYAHNMYNMRTRSSGELSKRMSDEHPCMVALACLAESDALCITESHSCSYDTYIYLFSTRVKFCASKCKIFVLLKSPRKTSMDRLQLIESLNRCCSLIRAKMTHA